MPDIRTEYAVQYTERLDSPPTVDAHQRDRTDLGRAEKLLAKVQAWQAEHGMPADAQMVTRTITTTDWAPITTHNFKVGDPVLDRGHSGWEFAGPDTMTPRMICEGRVQLKWVGSDLNMIAYGVDPANLALDTARTAEEVA
jgi:hypothetical protein